MIEPAEHNILGADESTEINHRQAIAEFAEDIFPAYRDAGVTIGEAMIIYHLVCWIIDSGTSRHCLRRSMPDQDIPLLDETISQLPQDIRSDLAERGRKDLFFFNSGVLGMRDMTISCHGPVCAYINLNPKQFKMILEPRDHLKTSVITIGGSMQMVVKNPENRLLIANES